LDKGDTSTLGATSTALVTEAVETGLTRQQTAVSTANTAITGDSAKITLEFTIGAGVSITIYSSGWFGQSSGSSLMAWHSWPAPIPVNAGDKYNQIFIVQFKAG